MKPKYLIAYFVVLLFITGCVPSRKYNDLLISKAKLEKDFNAYKVNEETNTRELKQLRKQVDGKILELNRLKADSAELAKSYAQLKSSNIELEAKFEAAMKQSEMMLSSSSSEVQVLNAQLSAKQRELDAKENDLKILAEKLEKSKTEIDAAKKALNEAQTKFQVAQKALEEKEASVNNLQSELAQREKRVNELESVIQKQEEQSKALRAKIAGALLGFNEADLSVEQRDGKVYVSLSQNLLFASGSTSIDSKGKDALRKLAEVLNRDTNFDIMIEGHTDNVPLRGSGQIKDNWDLSVMRSTSIVKELVKGGVTPSRIIAAGRGEYVPKADNETKEGRALNRRSEIILSPKLDELYQVIGN